MKILPIFRNEPQYSLITLYALIWWQYIGYTSAHFKFTFSLRTHSQKAIFRRNSKTGSHTKRISTQKYFSVSSVHKAEEKHAVKMFGSKFYTILSIKMNNNFSITRCVLFNVKFFSKLKMLTECHNMLYMLKH